MTNPADTNPADTNPADSRHVEAALRTLDERGFAVLASFMTADELAPALAERPLMFPSAEEFADDVDPSRNARFRDSQFGGVDVLPFASVEWGLLALHPKLIQLAERALRTADIRMYMTEAWAKYSEAVDYDQVLHRDYWNHTPLVPTSDPRFGHVELFVYLTDMTPEMGPTYAVALEHTADLPLVPHRVTREERPELYEVGEHVLGPAGTVLIYRTHMLHRGTAIQHARAARFTLHMNFRTAAAEWALRAGWGGLANRPTWPHLVERCTPRQLELFGFPPPGHAYWTEETLAGVQLRYPGLDMSAWALALA